MRLPGGHTELLASLASWPGSCLNIVAGTCACTCCGTGSSGVDTEFVAACPHTSLCFGQSVRWQSSPLQTALLSALAAYTAGPECNMPHLCIASTAQQQGFRKHGKGPTLSIAKTVLFQ